MTEKRINWNYIKKLAKAEGTVDYFIKAYLEEKKSNQLYDFILTLGLILKYWCLSVFDGFSEGNENVIYYNRFVGKLKGTRSNFDKQSKIMAWKQSLKS